MSYHHKLVKYRLTPEGNIPTFLKQDIPENIGGLFPVKDPNTPAPQDYIMVGISDYDADISDAIEEIESKEDLQTYLETQADLNSWKDVVKKTVETPFDSSGHAASVWSKLIRIEENR